jgi:N-acetylglucosamine-6-sulfatase
MRLKALLFAQFLLIHFLCGFTFAADATRPNLLFIFTDDQRWDCLSCMGHPFLKTPNIDRLATEGALFNNYFVTLPLCSPSRATLLTGQYAHTHEIVGNGDSNALSHRLITWPALLQKSGYETAYIGKLHMGNDDTPRPGFDRWVGFKGQGVYIDPMLNVDGKASKHPGYITDLLTDFAVDFINQKRDKPFAMILAHKAVHQPCVPAERHKGIYQDQPLPHRPDEKDDLSGKPVLRRNSGDEPAGHPARGVSEKQIREMLECIASVDEGVGKILAALEKNGQLDNTMIIFSSDNGYFFNEHNLGDKRAAYEESIRDPFLVRYPKLIKPGTKIDQMVLNVDLAPTMLELAGAPVPKNIQGRSFLPLLKGESSNWRTAALFEYVQEPRYPRIPTWNAVRTADWKYIHYVDLPDMDELYDLKNDPYEMKNLIADAKAADQLKQLKGQLQKELDATK